MTETLLARVPRSEMSPAMAAIAARSEAATGDPTAIEVLATSPATTRFFFEHFYGGLFHAGTVDRAAKELARLRLSTRHGCAFCNKANARSAEDAGLSTAKIEALFRGDDGVFDERERAVLDYADQVALTNVEGAMTPSLHARLRAHFDDGQIVELGWVMAVLAGVAKLLFVLNLVEREASCPFPHAHS